jgi:ribosomal protein L14
MRTVPPTEKGKYKAFASGAITAGKPVVVNSAGTVSQVSGASEATGTAVVFEDATTSDCCVTFDSSNNKVVIAYQDGGDSNKGKAVVGTVDSSDNSISFGTPVEFVSSVGVGDPDIVAITFDSNANKVVIVYKDGSNSGHAIVGTVSGTSVSFGTAASFNGSDNVGNLGCTFDSSNNKVVITYHDAGNSYHGTAVVGTVSGTDITFGSEAVFNSATTYEIGVTFDSSNNKVAIFYKDAGNSEHGYGKVGTVSGTDITYGSATEFNDAVTSYIFAGFDSSNNKVIVAYQDSHDGSGGRAMVATISGTSISFGSEATFNSGATLHPQVAFDSNVNKVIIMYEDDANSDYGTYAVGTVSGTSISFGSEIVFEAAAVEDLGIAFDSNANRMVMVYQDQGNSSHGTAIIQQSGVATNLTTENYIGIASGGTYADGQSMTVDTIGTVNADQSSLTAGQQYFVQEDGTLGLTADSTSVVAGTAISATELIVKE